MGPFSGEYPWNRFSRKDLLISELEERIYRLAFLKGSIGQFSREYLLNGVLERISRTVP